MMTLEEAIKHCKDVALSCTNKECALEHFQLLKWLQEYSSILKKQGERKPAWREEDERRVKDTIYFLDTAKKHYASTVELDACIDWLKSLKDKVQPQPQPKQGWSEEDEKMLDDAIGAVGAADYYTYDDKQEIENWLKSLKQRIGENSYDVAT